LTERRRVCIGALRGAFGVRGDVRLASYTENPCAVADYGALESEDGGRRFRIQSMRPLKTGFAARMDGIDSRGEAMALKGTKLFVPRDRLPATAAEEYYWADLMASEALDVGGASVGKVAAVHNFGAGDLLEVEPAQGGHSVLVPFTREAVPEVGAGWVRLAEWPPVDRMGGRPPPLPSRAPESA